MSENLSSTRLHEQTTVTEPSHPTPHQIAAARKCLSERNITETEYSIKLHEAKAARNGHTECVQLLLATPDININKWSCSEGRPLNVAKDYNHEECAQCLRQAGAR